MRKEMAALCVACLLLVCLAAPAAAREDVTLPWTYAIPLSILEDADDVIRLANNSALLDKDYVPRDLVSATVKKTSSSKIELRNVTNEALARMFDAAKADGLTLYLHSGYRSYRTQNTMHYNRVQKIGYDDRVVMQAGASDHQTGLGVDVISKAWIGKSFTAKFAETKEAQWMATHCAEYGFVIRYPEGKEDITEVIFEPWHLRYVGVEVAQYMTENGLTLEEFTLEWQAAHARYVNGEPEPAESEASDTASDADVFGEVVIIGGD